MNDATLALELAADFGGDVAAETERRLNGAPLERERERLFLGADTLAIASFIVTVAQLAAQLWQAKQERANLLVKLAEWSAQQPIPGDDTQVEKRLAIVGRAVDKVAPGNAEGAVDDTRVKHKWVCDWVGYGERALSPPLLRPFGDMRYFALHEPVFWERTASASSDLPSKVIVEKGFVTDLASVPRAFWTVIPPAGQYGLAAIIHDWLYWTQPVPRDKADRVFKEVMIELGVDPALRKVMWASVRVFGGGPWRTSLSERRSGGQRIARKVPSDATTTWDAWRKQPGVLA